MLKKAEMAKVLEMYDAEFLTAEDKPFTAKMVNTAWERFKATHVGKGKFVGSSEELAEDIKHYTDALTKKEDFIFEILDELEIKHPAKAKKKAKPKATINKTPEEPKFSSITKAMYWLFDTKGPENVSVEEATKLARKVKSNTKFNKWHLYFHRKNYRQAQYAIRAKEIGEERIRGGK